MGAGVVAAEPLLDDGLSEVDGGMHCSPPVLRDITVMS